MLLRDIAVFTRFSKKSSVLGSLYIWEAFEPATLFDENPRFLPE